MYNGLKPNRVDLRKINNKRLQGKLARKGGKLWEKILKML